MTDQQRAFYNAAAQRAAWSLSTGEIVRGWLRYEAVRRLNARQYAELCQRNIKGEGSFDDLVDQLVIDLERRR